MDIRAAVNKPIVLHIGEAIKYNHEIYEQHFAQRYNIVQNDRLDRESFKEALKNDAIESMDDLFQQPLRMMWKCAYPSEEEKVRRGVEEKVLEGKGKVEVEEECSEAGVDVRERRPERQGEDR